MQNNNLIFMVGCQVTYSLCITIRTNAQEKNTGNVIATITKQSRTLSSDLGMTILSLKYVNCVNLNIPPPI